MTIEMYNLPDEDYWDGSDLFVLNTDSTALNVGTADDPIDPWALSQSKGTNHANVRVVTVPSPRFTHLELYHIWRDEGAESSGTEVTDAVASTPPEVRVAGLVPFDLKQNNDRPYPEDDDTTFPAIGTSGSGIGWVLGSDNTGYKGMWVPVMPAAQREATGVGYIALPSTVELERGATTLAVDETDMYVPRPTLFTLGGVRAVLCGVTTAGAISEGGAGLIVGRFVCSVD